MNYVPELARISYAVDLVDDGIKFHWFPYVALRKSMETYTYSSSKACSSFSPSSFNLGYLRSL